MKTVTISQDEARRVLNLLRFIQMELSAISQALPETSAPGAALRSNEFAGELNFLVNSVEGSLHESETAKYFDDDSDDLPQALLN